MKEAQPNLKGLKKELRRYSSSARKKANAWFFKTEKGEYGYGDKFIGVSVPHCRLVAGKFEKLPLLDVWKLLSSKIHEERLTALVILIRKFKHGDLTVKKKIYRFYLKNFKHVNNWDLVDTSAHKIAGAYMLIDTREKKKLALWARSKNLWTRRLSLIATFPLIARGEYAWSLKNAQTLLRDSHDLTHKALGWMLRETWKRNPRLVEQFLRKNYRHVPRTTLRYAIERMDEKRRKKFLNLV